MGEIKIDSTNLATSLLQGFVTPRINSITYASGNAADPAGGETITVKGTGFQYGAVVRLNSVAVGVTTVVDFNTITFTTPAKSSGNYTLTILNPDGGMGTLATSFAYSSSPTWSTASGSLGSSYESQTLRTNLSANSDSAVTFSLSSGTLPAGATLASNGLLSGTLSNVNNATTYSFTIAATDAESQSNTRSFSYVVNADIVTFSTANNLTMNVSQNTAITTNTIVASAASGQTVNYSSSSLPSGISINATSGAITGTPTGSVGNTASIIIATANTTNKTANITFNFVVGAYVPPSVTASILMVAGGGGGGTSNYVAGGGAGGMVVNTYSLATSTTYTITVGGGGVVGGNGSNTTIVGTGLSLTAIGGGYGSGWGGNGGAGGSGGGAAQYTTSIPGTAQQPSSGTGGYGYNGGNPPAVDWNNITNGNGGGAGGGGAGGTGGTAPRGNGGIGRTNNFRTGSDTYYAGGGGGGDGSGQYSSGGFGGSGGGGDGQRSFGYGGSSGQAYTGGGGGGVGGGVGSSGQGGSGIVVITYAGSQKYTGGTVTTVGANTVHSFTSSGSLTPS